MKRGIYQHYIRPEAMFQETLFVQGIEVPRFRWIAEDAVQASIEISEHISSECSLAEIFDAK